LTGGVALDVRPHVARPPHVASRLVGDAGRRGTVAARLGARAAVAARCRVADRLRSLPDAAAPPAVARRRRQPALVALEARAVLRRPAAARRRARDVIDT